VVVEVLLEEEEETPLLRLEAVVVLLLEEEAPLLRLEAASCLNQTRP
jgi:hypothetical protein